MPVYYEVINGTIYVCNRDHKVKTPAAGKVVGLNSDQLREVCDVMNATYKAGYQTALNQLRAKVDQMEVANAPDKKGMH